MTNPKNPPFMRRLLVFNKVPIQLCDFIDHYRQELGCSREEAAFASADILRRLETSHQRLNIEACWIAEVLDHSVPRSSCELHISRLIRYFELQALSKSKREPFILAEDTMGAEFRASDSAIYFSPSALTRLIEASSGQAKTPKFIYLGEVVKDQGNEAKPATREHLNVKELVTVKRLTGELIKMIIASARDEKARRFIMSSTLYKKADAGKGPYSTADGLAHIASQLGLSDLPDQDTMAKYLPDKPDPAKR